MRTLFVGDVHGCAHPFARLLEKLRFDPLEDRLFLTGDAFSRGPDPAWVWEQINATGAAMVLGNHDARLREQLLVLQAGGRPEIRREDQRRTLKALVPYAGELALWLDALPLYLREREFLLVHAGVHPRKGLRGSSRDHLLTIRTWPPTGGVAGPRWHDYYRPRQRLLIFGHDAPGGLVVKRRRGRPYLVGLDSGCCYGGSLSAYVLEEDRIVQVEGWKKGQGGAAVP